MSNNATIAIIFVTMGIALTAQSYFKKPPTVTIIRECPQAMQKDFPIAQSY